ncbi:MAG: hypothetical protein IH956_01090 [Chloroflexi bacterium]|nr:hypothetical protein [Chloroflexota bacterium]
MHHLLEADPLIMLAHESARAAVLEAWLLIENQARQAAIRSHVEVSPTAPTTRMVKLLANRGLITGMVVAIINDLRSLRNEAVHAEDFALSARDAREYVDVARRVARALQGV